MGDSPSTRPSLLLRIRDPADHEAWRQFVTLYAPLVYQFARKRGLQDADAADLTQTVFEAVAQGIGRLDYDPQRGSFRGWLFAVTRNQLHKWLTRARRNAGRATLLEGDALAEVAAEENEESLWDHEYQLQLFRWACEQVQPEFTENTWLAFWRTAVEGAAAKDVGAGLAMSVGAVYTARSRVLRRLRDVIGGISEAELPTLPPTSQQP